MVYCKPLPIGKEFYKKIIDDGCYYVDKTLFIKDLLLSGSEVTLITRPRRFGKTLALTTVQTFFEKEILSDGTIADNSRYFEGKKIMSAGEEYTCHIGQYPVIFLSLKSAKQPDFKTAYGSLIREIIREFERHRYVLNSDFISDEEKNVYTSIIGRKAGTEDYAGSLKILSECLEKYHHKKVIILLDEYDVPLENAYFSDFYSEMVGFIRSLFESALKTNNSLKFAVVTGCLRISRESIFTGLNNLKVVSILDESYAESFGFVQQEIDSMLDFYGISSRTSEVKEWYNGYLFGDTEVYNPWSMINYVYDIVQHNTEYPKPYWSNTSSNSIVRELIQKADNETKAELEELIMGNAIEKPIHEDITYGDIYESQDNLWNFLFFTGYLKAVSRSFKSDTIYLMLKLPNREIRYIYNNKIIDWFKDKVKALDFSELYNAIVKGDTEVFENCLRNQLNECISFWDSAENFYHGFLLGLLGGIKGYTKSSNRESGEGRYDIVLIPHDERNPAVILELKRVKHFTEMEAGCEQALQQIEEKHYDAELIDIGYPVIMKYGICFCRKSCKVKVML